MLKKLLDKIRNRQRDGVLKHSIIYFSFVAAITLLNILFRKYIAVDFSLEDFGTYTPLLALFTLLATPFNSLNMFLGKKMAYFKENDLVHHSFSFHRSYLRIYLPLLLVYTVVVSLVIPWFQGYFKLNSFLPLAVVIAIFVTTALGHTYAAAHQAFQSFAKVGTINLLAIVMKFAGLLLLLEVFKLQQQDKHITALLSFLIPNTFILVFGMVFLRHSRRKYQYVPDRVPINIREMWRDVYPIIILMVLYGFMRSMDEFFVKHFFSKRNAGLYASLVTIGKSSVFLLTAVVYVLYPKISSKVDSLEATRRIMYKGLVMAVGGCMVILAVLVVFPDLAVRVLTDAKYLETANILKWFFVAYAPYSLLFLFINFFVVYRSVIYSIGLFLLTGIAVFLYRIHNATFYDIIQIMGIMGYLMLAYTIVYWLFFTKKVARTQNKQALLKPDHRFFG